MKALRCSPPSVELIQEAPVPQPKEGEKRIHVRMAGICRTDLELTRGYMGFEGILGHEFVGETEEGERVVGEINAGCGKCGYCKRGLQRHCPNRTVLGILQRDGCMAEYLTLPQENLYPVPRNLEDRFAVFTEPLAAALEIFEQIHIPPYERVCVLGDGKLGLLITLAFAYKHEGTVRLIGRHQKKLEIVSDVADALLEENLHESEYKSWDIVVDATGSSSGLRTAMNLVRPRGTIVLKSTMAHAEALDLTPLVIDEINVVGSRCGQFAPALSFMQRHPLPLERLIEAIYTLDEAQTAWEVAQKKGARKVLLQLV